MQLERPAHTEALGLRAFDAWEDGVALVDAQARLHYANPALKRMLRQSEGLCLRARRLQTTDPASSERLGELILRAGESPRTPGEALHIHTDAGHRLALRCMPVRAGCLLYHPERALTLIMVTSATTEPLPTAQALRRRHGFTPAQSRLAATLASGAALREAARHCGISYETARVYLKQLFLKTGAHRQAELVGVLLRGSSGKP